MTPMTFLSQAEFAMENHVSDELGFQSWIQKFDVRLALQRIAVAEKLSNQPQTRLASALTGHTQSGY
jgi:hypothetical protein